ncbi:MAG: response regulator [Syntrophales bacterium]
MKILIAEDDATSRALLTAVLKKSGHEVVETRNGTEAWELLQKPDSPRLAILDWMMPDMDGLEVVRRVRALHADQTADPAAPAAARHVYLILLTTKTEKADIVAGLNAGADDYLGKPYHQGELSARVEVGRRMVEMKEALAAKVEELRRALDQIKTLRGIIPICASCKKIRDDAGYWNQLEAFIRDHSEAEFSHSICPECVRKLYPMLGGKKTGETP